MEDGASAKTLNKNLVIIFLLLAGIVTFLYFFLSSRPSPRKIIFGAWTEGFFDGSTKTLHPEKMLEFENLIGRKVAIAHYYLGWEFLPRSELLEQFKIIRSHGWQPMLNVNPYFFDKCPVSEAPLYRAIAQGHCDNFLREAGKNLKEVKDPFYLNFAWEMNNHNNEWSVSVSGSTSEDFIAAWRHIHKIFKEEKAENIIWVFNPNVPNDPLMPYEKIYPGDSYVDWVGLDGYNWGTTQEWSDWVDFAGVFRGAYDLITRVAPDKPVMLAEVNTTDKGGDKAKWYKDMFLNQIPANFPKIEAVIIFNEDKSAVEKVNWKVDINPESLKAFKEAVNSPHYK